MEEKGEKKEEKLLQGDFSTFPHVCLAEKGCVCVNMWGVRVGGHKSSIC